MYTFFTNVIWIYLNQKPFIVYNIYMPELLITTKGGKSYLDFITPACKVSKGVDGHAHVCLQGEGINSPGVNALQGS